MQRQEEGPFRLKGLGGWGVGGGGDLFYSVQTGGVVVPFHVLDAVLVSG